MTRISEYVKVNFFAIVLLVLTSEVRQLDNVWNTAYIVLNANHNSVKREIRKQFKRFQR